MKNVFAAVALIGATLIATTTLAEEATQADPAHYTVDFENDKVRIIRVKYGPGEQSVMHTHGPHVIIALTDGEFHMTLPDGTVENIEMPARATGWSDANEHLPKNLGSTTAEVILVEIKD